MRFALFVFILSSVLCANSALVHAQSLPNTEEFSITISPAYPRPYDTVRITVSSSLIDLSASTIVISVNGTVVGENERTTTFTMGGPGKKSLIHVKVTNSDGVHEAEKSVAPADVALVVEPTSTVPPFYPGARLVASEGRVRLIALPDFQTADGTKIPPQSLVYNWKFGDRVLESDSGIGKNVLSAVAPVRYRDAEITLTVTTQDKSLVAQASTTVSPVDPFIRIYQNDPLKGIDLATAITGMFTMTNDEQTFSAVPYYYSTFPEVAWTLNGADSDHDPDLTVRTTGTTQGTAVLGVRASDKNALNNSESRFTIQFGASRSTGIFGL